MVVLRHAPLPVLRLSPLSNIASYSQIVSPATNIITILATDSVLTHSNSLSWLPTASYYVQVAGQKQCRALELYPRSALLYSSFLLDLTTPVQLQRLSKMEWYTDL